MGLPDDFETNPIGTRKQLSEARSVLERFENMEAHETDTLAGLLAAVHVMAKEALADIGCG